MAFQNPQRRINIQEIQSPKRNIPLEQIIATGGNNPLATGIETGSQVIGQALMRRAQLRQQGEELAALSKMTGRDYSGVNPEIAKTLAMADLKSRQENYSAPQLAALTSGDNAAISSTFPNGVPPGAATFASTASNREEARRLREQQMGALQDERAHKKIENRTKEKSDIVNKFNADPGVRKIQSSIDASSNVRELANSGNPIAASAIPTYMARASGEVGNLSEADKRPFGGSQAIINRLESALTQMATGRLTQSNQKFINDLANVMESSAVKNLDSRAKQVSDQYGEASDFLKSEDIYKTLRPIKLDQPKVIVPKKVGRFQIEVE